MMDAEVAYEIWEIVLIFVMLFGGLTVFAVVVDSLMRFFGLEQ